MRSSITTSLTTVAADTPGGSGLDVETVYGGRTNSDGATDTPGAMVVGRTTGVAEADGIRAGALAQAAVQTTTIPTPTANTAFCDRPHPVTWRPRETWRDQKHSRWPPGWTTPFDDGSPAAERKLGQVQAQLLSRPSQTAGQPSGSARL